MDGHENPLRRQADAAFIRSWLKSPLKMGAVSPSSRALGRRMAEAVPDEPADGVVVELGPGTGVVTGCLLESGIEPDHLVCLEYAPEFCTLLRARFPRVHILQGDAYAPPAALKRALAGRPLRAVVSSLPLMTRPEHDRERAVAGYLDLLPPGAPFIQFSYAFAPPVRARHVGAEATVSPWIKRNLPPARVITYRRDGG
ncbi:rRNA adenine N-6-methyltransferase family protein [Aureimonas sp. SK2]|uniref:class I SAM-dependent methyltransferase n=1 Tax=Aureimonas sp. SK2 TaxID=3015992 RepID=UPI002444EC8A|nr:rRNA adenine N-6-methyltransferase family protein [Aureimonas sp. SK2]